MTHKTLKNTEYDNHKLHIAIRCFLDIIKELKIKNISNQEKEKIALNSVEFKEMYLLQNSSFKQVFNKKDLISDFYGFLGTVLHPMLAHQILKEYQM